MSARLTRIPNGYPCPPSVVVARRDFAVGTDIDLVLFAALLIFRFAKHHDTPVADLLDLLDGLAFLA